MKAAAEIPVHQLRHTDFHISDSEGINLGDFESSHRVDFFAIIWFDSDGGNHYIDFKPYPVRKNRIYLLAPNQVHALPGKRPASRVILFSWAFFDRIEEDELRLLFLPFDKEGIVVPDGLVEPLGQLFGLMSLENKGDNELKLLNKYTSALLWHLHRLSKDTLSLPAYHDERLGRLFQLVKEVALIYAAEGARVIVSDIVEKGGQETVAEIKAHGGEAFFIKADTGSAVENEALVKKTIDRYGALHIVCNNAGIGGPLATVGEYPLEGWDKVISINLSGVFYGMRFQIPAILASGGGAIVNMASILGQVGTPNSSAYVAAKHGVVGLTQTAAIEYAQKNIRINAVGPGYINTPLVAKSLDKASFDALAGQHPMGRLGESREIAELVLWLSSDKASFVTGSYYNADGGYLAK